MTYIPNLPSEERDEIEVTPEMLKAGLDEYALFDSVDPGEWVVSAVYRAMARAARGATAYQRAADQRG
jgi:hypothetical protein